MMTIRLTHRHRRPARPRWRSGFALAVERMEGRLALSHALLLPHAGAAAAVAHDYPPVPGMRVGGVGLSACPLDPSSIAGAIPGSTGPDLTLAWVDGPVET